MYHYLGDMVEADNTTAHVWETEKPETIALLRKDIFAALLTKTLPTLEYPFGKRCQTDEGKDTSLSFSQMDQTFLQISIIDMQMPMARVLG